VLDQVLRVQRQTDGRLERLAGLQRMMLLVQRDLAAAVPGSVQGDTVGIGLRTALDGGSISIDYQYDGSTFSRSLTEAPSARQILLPDVQALQWQYLDSTGQWYDAWPQSTQSNAPALWAVDMTLSLPHSGETLRRIVAVPQPGPP
jgi:general secretion pathway protein J